MSKYFKDARPLKPHLLRAGGTLGEVRDLRKDIAEALDVVEADITSIVGGGGGILIDFSFDGASPPIPGGNLNRHGICHTTGGTYLEGVIYLDNGTALTEVPASVGQLIATTTPVAGDLIMEANSIYALTYTTPQPILWVKKGGGAGIVVVTTAQRLALSAVDGQVVYDTDDRKLYVWQFDIDWPVWAEV